MLFNLEQKAYRQSECAGSVTHRAFGHTMLSTEKLSVLYEHGIMVKVLELNGDVAEAGTWEGGSAFALASALPSKAVHIFDSWEGLPEPSAKDYEGMDEQPMIKGWGKCIPPTEFLSHLGDRIVFHKGWFDNTLNSVEDKKFCIVHVDCDQYNGVKQCLEFFYPRVVRNGIVIIDDYGFHLTPGATSATDEFFADKMDEIVYTPHAGLNIRKL